MKVQKWGLLIVITTAVIVFGGMAGAQEKSSGTFGESAALDMAYQWASFVGQGDISGLEGLLSDHYMHIHATALVESKAQFIKALQTGERKYDPIRIEEPTVRIFGPCALVTGKFILKAFSRGRTIEGVNRFGIVLVKTPNGPQVVSFQATPIPQQK